MSAGRLPRVGVELELMAPPGLGRDELARALAGRAGWVEPFLHPDSEPCLVPGQPVFETLTPGFRARAPDGQVQAELVDDLTLQEGLDRQAPPRPGWWRILSDDRRILHLVRRHGRADLGPEAALEPLATLFGVSVERLDGGVLRVRDPDGAPLALASGVPGERWRPAELVTPPMPPSSPRALRRRLEALLAPARALGFTIPAEAAVHLHLDAGPFRQPAAFAGLVRLLHERLPAWKERAGSNPANQRRGPLPEGLRAVVEAPDFASLPWAEACQRLRALPLTKYADVNLRNVVFDVPGKPTLELRFLPGAIEAEPVVEALAWIGEELAGVCAPSP